MSRRHFTLQPLITITEAQFTASATIHGPDKFLGTEEAKRIVMCLDVTAHAGSTGTYNFYITTGHKLPDGTVARWDLAAFTQIADADSAVTYVAFIGGGSQQPTSNIADGTVTKMPSILSVTATHLRGTLTAGFARHGYIGDFLSYTVTGAGTTPGPITFELSGMVWS